MFKLFGIWYFHDNFRFNWCCFQTRIVSKATNLNFPQISQIRSNSEYGFYPETVSTLLASESTNCESLYEDIPEVQDNAKVDTLPRISTNSSDIYDQLEFQQPQGSLHGHYHSSRTLKSLNSEDYLNPIDVTDIWKLYVEFYVVLIKKIEGLV